MAATHRLCCDLGYVENLALVLVDLRTNQLVWGEVFALLASDTLEKEKRKHVKSRDFRATILERLTHLFQLIPVHPLWTVEFVAEAQFCERRGKIAKNGRDLIWLESAITTLAHQKGFRVRDPIRNCDACKKVGIPAAKTLIKRDRKKQLTITVVNEKMGLKLTSDHLADALLLHLAC